MPILIQLGKRPPKQNLGSRSAAGTHQGALEVPSSSLDPEVHKVYIEVEETMRVCRKIDDGCPLGHLQ
jgi:hypothetical protein